MSDDAKALAAEAIGTLSGVADRLKRDGHHALAHVVADRAGDLRRRMIDLEGGLVAALAKKPPGTE